MIPLFVGLAGRCVIIFGGGEVAARKAAFFIREADVQVLSRSHSKSVLRLPVTCRVLDVKNVADEEIAQIVSKAFIVVAALSDSVQNNRIGEICKQQGILFNNANGDCGDLIIPSVSSGKRYMIAVSTLGKSPAISRFVREHIDRTFIHLDEMIELQDTLRQELRKIEPSRERRSAILRNIARDPDVWNALSHSLQEAGLVTRRKYFP